MVLTTVDKVLFNEKNVPQMDSYTYERSVVIFLGTVRQHYIHKCVRFTEICSRSFIGIAYLKPLKNRGITLELQSWLVLGVYNNNILNIIVLGFTANPGKEQRKSRFCHRRFRCRYICNWKG